MSKKIAIIVGSLRKDSINRKIANQVINLAPANLEFEIVEIVNLPLYNEDIDGANPPQEYTDFRSKLKDKSGVIFVTPEYNRSMPAAIKNALDVGSRPYGHSVWNKMAGAVISSSPSNLGAFGSNHHLRQSCVFLNIYMLQQPEAYLNNAFDIFDENNNLKERTKTFLQNFVNEFALWVEKAGR